MKDLTIASATALYDELFSSGLRVGDRWGGAEGVGVSLGQHAEPSNSMRLGQIENKPGKGGSACCPIVPP